MMKWLRKVKQDGLKIVVVNQKISTKIEAMKYTKSQVRDMSPMEYWEAMCQELKKAGFQGQRGNRPPHDYEPFDAVFGGDIVFNLDAVHYLQNMGLLDNGKCPMCGIREDAVNYALSYQNGATFHVCKNCYKQYARQEKQKRGCACCLIVLAVLGVIIYGIVQLLIL